MSVILNSAVQALVRLKYPAIARWIAEPDRAQSEVFNDLMRAGEHTIFGAMHQFSNIHTRDDFRARVPLSDYETMKPYIEQIMRAEDNVLWNTPTEWLAKSSGTTSDKSKFIPVSGESLAQNHFLASKELLYNYYYHHPDTKLLEGKMLVVGGSHQVSSLNQKIQYGDLSAVLMQNEPSLSRWIRVPELAIALLDEWEEKIEQLALTTMNEKVTALAGVPTWTLVLLKKILQLKQARHIHEVWPHLELYVHGGVNFAPYYSNFETLLGRSVRYLEVYNASEGFFAFQEHPQDKSLLLLPRHGIFYEFLPLPEIGKPNPQTLLLHEVALDTVYALVITTNGGLWRYVVGDTVRFTRLRPYKIRVVGRTQQFINAFGEELVVANADKAMAQTCREKGLLLVDYTAAPIYFDKALNNAAHEWLVELEETTVLPADFAGALDTHLKALNSDYEAKRHKDIALQCPVVHFLPRGAFEHWLKIKGKLGGQHKVPRLSNSRRYVEEIKGMFSLS